MTEYEKHIEVLAAIMLSRVAKRGGRTAVDVQRDFELEFERVCADLISACNDTEYAEDDEVEEAKGRPS